MKRISATFLCIALPALAFFNACSKSEDASDQSSARSEDRVAVPMVPEQYRSANFTPVAERLDLGGSSYAFMDFGTALKGVGGKISQFLQTMNQFEPNPQLMMVSMMPIDKVIDALGISNLAAYGASSYQEDGLYHNKSVIHMPDGVKGLFAIAGEEAREFTGLAMAPRDSDIFIEFSIYSSAAEKMIQDVAEKIYGDQAGQVVEGMMSTRVGPDAPSVGEIFAKSDTNLIVVARLGAPINIDTPEIGALAIPTIEFAIGLQNMAWLIKDNAMPTDAMVPTQQGNMTIYRDAEPDHQDLPYMKDWDPAFVMMGEDLYIVNKVAYLEECLAGQTSLKNASDFQDATQGFPQQGNALMYVSKDAFNAYVDLRDRLVEAEPKVGAILPIYEWFMPILTITRQERASASITVVDATSIYNEDRWPVPGGGVNSMSGATTVGLLAAMAIPAFQKVREQSREKAITNNLRQIASAGQQYILEEGTASVSYDQLEGDYFAPIQPVNGEDYTQLVIEEDGGTIEVTTQSGETVTFTY